MKRCKHFCLVSITTLLFMSSIFAQEPAAPGAPAGTSTPKSEQTIIGGYSLNYLHWSKDAKDPQKNLYLLTPSPSFGDNLFSSLVYSYILKQQANDISTSNQNLFSLIKSTSSQATDLLHKNFETPFLLAPVKDLPLAFSYNVKKTSMEAKSIGTSEAAAKKIIDQSASHYNINALITPDQYKINTDKPKELSAEEQQAQNFIKQITGEYQPLEPIDFSSLYSRDSNNSDLIQVLNDRSVQEYLAASRKYAAITSVGLSNLNYLYDQRKAYSTKELLQKEGGAALANLPQGTTIPKDLQQVASTQAIDNWMATRRLSGSRNGNGEKTSWYDSVEKATPATLQRENLMLLAEMRYELYKNRKVNEKILATLSVITLQNNANDKLRLQQLRRAACQSDILQKSGACPTPTSGSGTEFEPPSS